MKAIDFLKHCQEVGSWVNWHETVDLFMHGDPEIEVSGIGVTWLATDAVLKQAAHTGCNFVISHEGAFYNNYLQYESEKKHHEAKHTLLDELEITLFRCHDTWDRMPQFGIADSWASFLQFPVMKAPVDSYYRVCRVENLSLEETMLKILEKVKPLGQKSLQFMGNKDQKINSLVIGTGAISRLPAMKELGGDLLLATDDGVHTTYCGLWSYDLWVPVVMVSHATAELPGMKAMVPYLEKLYPGTPVTYLPGEFPYDCITG